MLKKLWNIIKKHFFNSNDNIQSNEEIRKEKFFKEEILPNYSFGDIIWALRYDFDWDKEFIEENHRIGPYIVIGKTDEKLICMYCTSVEDKTNYFQIAKENDLFYKKTFTSLDDIRTIDYVSFINENDIGKKSISDDDKSIIAKKIYHSGKIKYSDIGDIKELQIDVFKYINPSAGDIIKDEDNGQLKLILKKDKNCINALNLSNNTYEISKISTNYRYIKTIDEQEFNNQLAKYNEYQKEEDIKKLDKIPYGALLNKGKTYYYVYNIEKDTAQLFLLNKQKNASNNSIYINNIPFAPNYMNTININIRNKEYIIKAIANEPESAIIANNRKIFLRKQKEKLLTKKQHLLNEEKKKMEKEKQTYNIGDIIKHELYFNMRFIVVGTYSNTLISISLSAYKDNKIVYREFDISNKSLSKCGKISNNIDSLQSLGDKVIELKKKRSKKIK